MADDPTQIDVYLYYPRSSLSYEARKLRCTSWKYIVGRQPMVQSLPGVRKSGTGEPGVLAIDFGSMSEDIQITGAISDSPEYVAGETDQTTTLMRWPEIETIWRTSWRFYEMGSSPVMPCILAFYEGSGAYYDHYVLPGKLHLARQAARAEWALTATFYTVRWYWT